MSSVAPPTPAGDPEPVVIACGADDRYAIPLAVTLHSAVSHLDGGRGRARIFVIDGGIAPANRRRLEEVLGRAGADVDVMFLRPEGSRLAGLKAEGYFSPSNYLRLLIPEVLPPTCGRALYLDSDLLIRADLRELWRTDLRGRALAAVLDPDAMTLGSPRGVANHRELGLDPAAPYVNSGVLVMDLDRWRAEDLAPRILRHLVEHHELIRFADQDGINAILAGACTLLDPRWNVPVYLASDIAFEALEDGPAKEALRTGRWQLLREAYIFHYLGARKPWQFGAGMPRQPAWLAALARSGWHGPGAVAPRLEAWALRADWLARTALRSARQLRPRGR